MPKQQFVCGRCCLTWIQIWFIIRHQMFIFGIWWLFTTLMYLLNSLSKLTLLIYYYLGWYSSGWQTILARSWFQTSNKLWNSRNRKFDEKWSLHRYPGNIGLEKRDILELQNGLFISIQSLIALKCILLSKNINTKNVLDLHNPFISRFLLEDFGLAKKPRSFISNLARATLLSVGVSCWVGHQIIRLIFSEASV